MSLTVKCSLHRDVINRLCVGVESDPFSLLGPHLTELGLELRAFIPYADAVYVIDGQNQQRIVTLSRLDDRGFFCDLISGYPQDFYYQLEAEWGESCHVFEDPYRFGLLLQPLDNWLLAEGTHRRPYECLGAHPQIHQLVAGVGFTVWAPNARQVSLVGEFNHWNGCQHRMRLRRESGVWELFLPGLSVGQLYKFEIIDCDGQRQLKSDPYGQWAEMRPNTASRVHSMAKKVESSAERQTANHRRQPISIYEVHLGSWRRHSDNNFWLSYSELADQLIDYVKYMGFSHIELMPINEHPFDGSWGYQPLGLYAPTSRFGNPDQFHDFVGRAHQAGINVLLDWVPAHFPNDAHGLVRFDGTALYEYADPHEGYHPDWDTLIYNFGRHEVSNFLSGNALYWLERFGIDGLRVDAVASMLYRDYSRQPGEWVANVFGGRENLEAIEFLRRTNQAVGIESPGAVTIAEESTDFYGVTMPPEHGGLGFHYKWNMGWMNDTLKYMQLDPVHRRHHHELLTFGMLYTYSENYILPLSHDEVVHGKGSLINKMSGDLWQKFANLRCYYAFMWGYPGKKLLFMGNEFAQWREWDHDCSLDWHLLDDTPSGNDHQGIQRLIRDLNALYRQHAALYELDCEPQGFAWLVVDDKENSVFVFLRRDSQNRQVIVACNFTPVPRYGYRFGVEQPGKYRELLNTDSGFYQGSNVGNAGSVYSDEIASHCFAHSLAINLPPLATLYLALEESQ